MSPGARAPLAPDTSRDTGPRTGTPAVCSLGRGDDGSQGTTCRHEGTEVRVTPRTAGAVPCALDAPLRARAPAQMLS